MQDLPPTMHELMEGENRPYHYWFRNSPEQARKLPRRWCYKHRPHGKIKICWGTSCFISSGIHVQGRFEARIQRKWILCLTSGFSLRSIQLIDWDHTLLSNRYKSLPSHNYCFTQAGCCILTVKEMIDLPVRKKTAEINKGLIYVFEFW